MIGINMDLKAISVDNSRVNDVLCNDGPSHSL